MPGPGGKEVGAVTIRVSPDTSKFRRELERELKGIAKEVTVTIPVKLDAKGVKAQLAAIKKDLASLRGVDISVTGDSAALNNSLKSTVTHAISLRTAFEKVKESIKGVAEGAKNAKEHTQRMAGTIHTVATQNPFKTIGQGASTLGRKVIDLDFNMKRFHKTGQAAATAISSGFSAASKAGGLLLDVSTVGIRHFSELSRVMKIVVAVTAALPVILGVVGGLLAGLPSLIAAAGAGIGVIALGMDGIKKAGEGFGKAIGPLKESISAIFEKRLGEQLQGFAGVLNKLKPQLKDVTNGLLDMSQGFFDSIKSAQGMESMKQILGGTAQLFKNLKPAVENVTTGFLTLASQGAQNFDLLSGVLNRFASSFKKMTDEMAGNGSLRDMFKGLAAVTDSLLQGFLKLFKVGAEALGKLGGPLASALTSIVDLIVDLVPLLTPIAKLILDVAGAFAEVLRPAIKALAPSIDLFAKALGSAIVPAIQAFGPLLQEVAVFLGQFLEALIPLFPVLLDVARVMADVFLEALKALKPIMPIIVNVIRDLAQMLSGALKQALPTLIEIGRLFGEVLVTAFKALEPVLPILVKTFLDLVQAILPVLPPLLQLIIDVLPPLVQLLVSLGKPILDLAVWLTKILIPAFTWVINVIKDVILWFLNIGKGLVAAAGDLLKWFSDLPNKIWGWVKGAGQWLWDTGKMLIRGLVDGIVAAANAVWDFFVGLPGRIARFFENAFNWLVDAGRNIMRGLIRGITDMMPALQNVNKKIADAMQGNLFSEFKIGSPSRLMMPIGEMITRGLAVGIEDGIPSLENAVGKIADQVQAQATDMSGSIDSSGVLTAEFGGLDAQIEKALSGWSIQLDAKGLAKLVRNADLKNKNGR